MGDALLSVEEVARRLGGLSPQTIYQWLTQGRMVRTKVGARTMIRESELQKVILEGGRGSQTGRPRSATKHVTAGAA